MSTGIGNLDNILGGGLTSNRAYLLEGTPGSGKTTIALQFLLEGARKAEKGLYITLSETAAELKEVARSHRWDLSGIELFELVNEDGLDPESEQSILEPSEVELGETIKGVMEFAAISPPDTRLETVFLHAELYGFDAGRPQFRSRRYPTPQHCARRHNAGTGSTRIRIRAPASPRSENAWRQISRWVP
jgi:KaiC/GvpD/RAD55 family RecA-like ATPase